jgi:GNAT superfamily N-acetyltransferase
MAKYYRSMLRGGCDLSTGEHDLVIKRLGAGDVAEATRICRLAFGTFLGMPDPTQAFGDIDPFTNRWKANPDRVLGAYLNGRLVGSNIVSRWGTFGLFGPLTVLPEFWGKGIAKKLLTPTMEMFSRWGTTHEGLFTFSNSPKHIGLYEGFGFNARFLTPVMKKQVGASSSSDRLTAFTTYSGLESDKDRNVVLNELMEVTSQLHDGLDLSDEIKAVTMLKLGDTIFVKDGSRTVGFAICHVGANTEAGSGNCYVKFGAVWKGSSNAAGFSLLLSAVESYAAKHGLATLEAGVNMGRREAYKQMIARGFQTEFVGIAMQRPDEAGFNRPDVFVLDDWR